jgi:acetylornithine deacetylase/succinyl-diaminopimelate desuccinylase-like protein
METYGDSIKALISFDLGTKHIINRAVGSHRYMVGVKTQGGHSFANFGRVNAISVAASIIEKLYSQTVPSTDGSKTTYNVGTIEGGTSVNTIAPICNFTYEYRSDNNGDLAVMKKSFEEILNSFEIPDCAVSAELIGDRPGMEAPKDPQASQKLLEIAESVIENVTGITPQRTSGSTDCNIPLSLGISSLCMGLIRMEGAHTRDEFVELDSLGVGIEIAVRVIADIISKDIW